MHGGGENSEIDQHQDEVNFSNSQGASRQRRKRNQLYFSLNSTNQGNFNPTNIQTINQHNPEAMLKSYETSSIGMKDQSSSNRVAAAQYID